MIFLSFEEASTMKMLAMLLILVVLAVALPSGVASAADDYVVHTFKCPQSTTVKFNWANKVQANPDFPLSPGHDNLGRFAEFAKSAVILANNTVQCQYNVPPLQENFLAWYIYKVPRKILSCTGQPGRHITCKLKPD